MKARLGDSSALAEALDAMNRQNGSPNLTLTQSLRMANTLEREAAETKGHKTLDGGSLTSWKEEIAFPPQLIEDRLAPAVRKIAVKDGTTFWVMSIKEVMSFWKDAVPPELENFTLWMDTKAAAVQRSSLAEETPQIGLPENEHLAILITTGSLLPKVRLEEGVFSLKHVRLRVQPVLEMKAIVIFEAATGASPRERSVS